MNSEMGGGKDFEVGYKKPPAGSRWQKGRSGNPSGKKKEQEISNVSTDPDDPEGLGKMLQEIDNELVVVKVGKKNVHMTRVELRLRLLFDKANKGGIKESRQIFLLAVKYYAPEAQADSSFNYFVKPDEQTEGEPSDKDVDLLKQSQSRKAKPKREPQQAVPLVSEGAVFRSIARQQISVEIDGKKRKLFRWQAFLRQLYTMSLDDNSSAARLLNQFRNRFPGDLPPGDPITYVIRKEDLDL